MAVPVDLQTLQTFTFVDGNKMFISMIKNIFTKSTNRYLLIIILMWDKVRYRKAPPLKIVKTGGRNSVMEFDN